MCFEAPKNNSFLCPRKNPLKFVREHGEARIDRILIAQQQEQHTQHQEYLIDPLRASHVSYKELNPGGEDNNHSSQPPKLHPMDKCLIFYKDRGLIIRLKN
jgi:hypothetical protein